MGRIVGGVRKGRSIICTGGNSVSGWLSGKEVLREPVLLEEGRADGVVDEEGRVIRPDKSVWGEGCKTFRIANGGLSDEDMGCCVSVRWCVCVCEYGV